MGAGPDKKLVAKYNKKKPGDITPVWKGYEDYPTKLTPEQYPKGCTKLVRNPVESSTVRWLFMGEDSIPRCSAKRSGWTPEEPRYCGGYPEEGGNGRCRYHGGKIMRANGERGRVTTAFRRYGREIPSALFDRYVLAAEDTELNSLSEEIALIDAKISNLLVNAEDWGGEEILEDVKEAFTAFQIAYRAKDDFKIKAGMARLESTVDRADHEATAWKQITNLIELRRRLVIAEVNRQKLLEQFIPAAQVQNLIASIIEAIKLEVFDEGTRVAIQNRINTLLGYDPGGIVRHQAYLPATVEQATADGEVLDGQVE